MLTLEAHAGGCGTLWRIPDRSGGTGINANPSLSREEMLAASSSRTRRLARLMYALAALAALAAVALIGLAVRVLVGFDADPTAELLLGALVIPLAALFLLGLALLAFRRGRELLRRRRHRYFPGD